MSTRNHKPVDQTIQFSLILPTYNRGYCIERAIQSVLYQTFSGYELIIVDDGSTDNTERIIHERYQKELACGRIRYLKQEENRGVCHSRNIGLAAAKNDWIAYIDSDNTIKRTFLATYVDAMKAYPKAKAFYANWKNANGARKAAGKKALFPMKRCSSGTISTLGCMCTTATVIARSTVSTRNCGGWWIGI
jgi:glycosyltransferase involved in cell wall biosynthesis